MTPGGLLVVLAALAATAAASRPPRVKAFFQGECKSWNPCHQDCIDLKEYGGFKCDCKPGYKLQENGFSCKEEPIAVTAAPEKPAEPKPADVQPEPEEDEATAIESLLEHEPEKTDAEESLLGLAHANVMLGDAPAEDEEEDAEDGEGPSVSKRTEYKWRDPWAPVSSRESREKNHWKNPYKSLEERQKIAEQFEGKDWWQWQHDDSAAQTSAEARGKGRGRGRGKDGRRRKGKGRKNKSKDANKAAADSAGVRAILEDTQSDSVASGNDVLEESSASKLHPALPTPNAGPPPRFQSCDQLYCKGSGRCVQDQMRGGVRCQCKLGTEGEFCENDVVVQYPKFMGTGYVAFPVLRGAYKEFTVTVSFRPDTHSGLLVFSSEHPNARSDFFSISLVDGKAEFRFDCGTGEGVITTENEVLLGEWNTITVQRTEWYGWIQLNDAPQVKGRSKGLFSRITFRENLYLGGYRDNSMIGQRTGMQWGFVGCVRRLQVNNKVYDMRKGAYVGDAIDGVDVGECSAHVCDEVKCQNDGVCVADSADSSTCLCPLGTVGDRCESKIDIHVPSFDGTSYLQFLGLRRTVLSFAEVEIMLKPEANDGLIFYNGFTTDRTGDYIALALRNGYVEYTFDLGTGPAYIRSRTPLSLHEWHRIRFSRTGRDGMLQIDDQLAGTGMSKGAYTQLTLTLDLFIGGHRNFDEVNKEVNMRKSFQGCLQKVVINEKPVKLIDESIGGVNIDNCNHPCVGQPCMNGGRCIAIRDNFKCSCPLGFESANCEDRKVRYRYRFKRAIEDPITTPMFNGDGFLKFIDPAVMLMVRGPKIEIQMKIKAKDPNGLILWTSESTMKRHGDSDYLAIGLRDGHAEFRYNLGSGEVVISYNNTNLVDGKWHKIKVERNNQVGYLEVDATEIVEGSSPGNLKQLNVRNKLFIGGMYTDEIRSGTGERYSKGFSGCIKDVVLATEYKLDLMAEAEDGENIHQCRSDSKRKQHHKKEDS